MKSTLDKLESRFGHYAIPGLVQMIATLQFVTLLVFTFLPVESRQPYEDLLAFDLASILSGQVWRLFSYVFIPVPNPLFAFIAFMFMMFLGRGMEEWGAFRVNLYVFGGMASMAIGAAIFPFQPDAFWIYLAVLLAFASMYPNEEIMLFFVIPVKIKWLAIFAAASVLLGIFSSPMRAIPAFFALANYLVAFAPGFFRGQLQAARAASRRSRFEAGAPSGDFFHQCSLCGKTELDDSTLDFRVNDRGEEICSACRK